MYVGDKYHRCLDVCLLVLDIVRPRHEPLLSVLPDLLLHSLAQNDPQMQT